VPYGLFIGEVVNFLIIAVVLFVFLVKFLGLLTKSQQKAVTAPPPPTRDQQLLMEIRDLLADREKGVD